MAKKEKPQTISSGQATAMLLEQGFEILPPEIDQLKLAEDLWSFDDLGFDLTIEQHLFCRSYIVDRNPVAAMRRLNYSGDVKRLKRIADQHLRQPEVIACIDELAKRLMAKLEVTAERVQRRIASVAFFDPRQVVQFDADGVVLLNSKFWSEEQIQAVQSVKMGANGIEIKFYDGLRAAEMLAKQLGVQPEDDLNQRAEAAKAGAEAVIDKIVDIFEKLVPDDPTPALPSPEPRKLN